jgi:hypothetical protein
MSEIAELFRSDELNDFTDRMKQYVMKWCKIEADHDSATGNRAWFGMPRQEASKKGEITR